MHSRVKVHSGLPRCSGARAVYRRSPRVTRGKPGNEATVAELGSLVLRIIFEAFVCVGVSVPSPPHPPPPPPPPRRESTDYKPYIKLLTNQCTVKKVVAQQCVSIGRNLLYKLHCIDAMGSYH